MPDWKYSEGKILCELQSYLASTYGQHYVGEDNVQVIDLLGSMGHERSFAIGNIIKYASRQGKKRGQERADILKILHYAIFLLHFHDKESAAATREAAITLAETHNTQAENDVVRCPHCKQVLRTRWKDGPTAVERAKRLHERQLSHFAKTQREAV